MQKTLKKKLCLQPNNQTTNFLLLLLHIKSIPLKKKKLRWLLLGSGHRKCYLLSLTFADQLIRESSLAQDIFWTRNFNYHWNKSTQKLLKLLSMKHLCDGFSYIMFLIFPVKPLQLRNVSPDAQKTEINYCPVCSGHIRLLFFLALVSNKCFVKKKMNWIVKRHGRIVQLSHV